MFISSINWPLKIPKYDHWPWPKLMSLSFYSRRSTNWCFHTHCGKEQCTYTENKRCSCFPPVVILYTIYKICNYSPADFEWTFHFYKNETLYLTQNGYVQYTYFNKGFTDKLTTHLQSQIPFSTFTSIPCSKIVSKFNDSNDLFFRLKCSKSLLNNL